LKFTYLFINLISVFFPLILSFDKKVQFYKSWRFIWPGMAITGLIFLFWDILFTAKGVWYFNPKYITGIKVLQLPIEEILFFLTVPFACLFIYACLNYYIKWEINIRLTRIVSNLLIIFAIIILIFYHHRMYTRVTFTLLAFMVVLLQFFYKAHWLNRFYMAWVVCLVPFYIINGLLTSLPVVLYNDAENLGRRIGTIPVEDHFYCMALLLMNVAFFEYFRRKSKAKLRYV
jgi:lycopene cyclase domain-containing protein